MAICAMQYCNMIIQVMSVHINLLMYIFCNNGVI